MSNNRTGAVAATFALVFAAFSHPGQFRLLSIQPTG